MAPDARGRSWIPLVSLVGCCIVLLSACRVKLDVTTEVERDGSGQVAVTVLLDQTIRETLSEGGRVSDDPEVLREVLESGDLDALNAPDGPDPLDVLESDAPAGWEPERVKVEKLEGVVLRADFVGLDELPSLLGSLSSWGDELTERTGYAMEQVGVATLTKGFSLTREDSIFRFRAEPSAEAYEGAIGGPNNLEAELSVSLKLPGGIREHDADEEVDGALVWYIPPGESRSISAVSDLNADSGGFPLVPVAVGVAAVGLAGLVWVRAWRARQERTDANPEPPDSRGVREEEPVPV